MLSKKNIPENKFIYLDHGASTPTDVTVVEAMLPYFSEMYGNPSGVHQQARNSKQALNKARRDIAQALKCQTKEVIFTSGGTESDNMAVRGVAWAQRFAEKGNHIITSPIEHSAVSETIDYLCRHHGFEQTQVPVNQDAMVSVADVKSAIRHDTILIAIMTANNEVGTIQPMAEIGSIAKEHDIPFFSDSVQIMGAMDINLQEWEVDLLSFSAHKFYGAKGVGMLFMRAGTPYMPHSTGASHEEGRRPGTENIPYIVGMAKAVQLATEHFEDTVPRLIRLRDKLISGVLDNTPKSYLTGHAKHRLPNHASFIFHGCDATSLLIHLDRHGIGAASGSACATGMPEPSKVLLAMGIAPQHALGALRLTLGKSTTESDIDYVLETLPQIVQTVRDLV